MKKQENKRATPCLVHLVSPKDELKQVNISMDAGLLAEIDHAAKSIAIIFIKRRSSN